MCFICFICYIYLFKNFLVFIPSGNYIVQIDLTSAIYLASSRSSSSFSSHSRFTSPTISLSSLISSNVAKLSIGHFRKCVSLISIPSALFSGGRDGLVNVWT